MDPITIIIAVLTLLLGIPPAVQAFTGKSVLQWIAQWRKQNAIQVLPVNVLRRRGHATNLPTLLQQGARYYTNFPHGKIGRGWLWIDPLGDCKVVRRRPNGIAIYIPAKEHDLWPSTNFNAPRLLRRVQAPFVLTVHVECEPRASVQGVGVLLWGDERNFCRLNYVFHDLHDPVHTRFIMLEGRFNANYVVRGISPCATSRVYLRIMMQNDVIEGAFSYDRDTWWNVGRAVLALEEEIQVGVFGINEWNDRDVHAIVLEFAVHPLPNPDRAAVGSRTPPSTGFWKRNVPRHAPLQHSWSG